jgi:hypothetical protein
MRLGGWARLGVVVSFLYGIVVVVIAFYSMPSRENYESMWIYDSADVIAHALTEKTGKTHTLYEVKDAFLEKGSEKTLKWLAGVASHPTDEQKIYSSEVLEVNKRYELKMARLPSECFHHWLNALFWWLGGSAVLFASGTAVGWIYRGFKQS